MLQYSTLIMQIGSSFYIGGGKKNFKFFLKITSEKIGNFTQDQL